MLCINDDSSLLPRPQTGPTDQTHGSVTSHFCFSPPARNMGTRLLSSHRGLIFISCKQKSEEKQKMVTIQELASEVLESIFKHLSALDLAVAAQTCRRFRDVCAIDDIWHKFCIKGEAAMTQ